MNKLSGRRHKNYKTGEYTTQVKEGRIVWECTICNKLPSHSVKRSNLSYRCKHCRTINKLGLITVPVCTEKDPLV